MDSSASTGTLKTFKTSVFSPFNTTGRKSMPVLTSPPPSLYARSPGSTLGKPHQFPAHVDYTGVTILTNNKLWQKHTPSNPWAQQPNIIMQSRAPNFNNTDMIQCNRIAYNAKAQPHHVVGK
eukprot:TRINITY_DN9411_c0_g1_i1.p2 TRINITY_DN9411_c0_g1~~TRINITY_DN9411_c0_g1_i1.p2  ORF type:complete len:122 (-),score=20.98 TRINITY_DN9411_c0_g1_i1:77-442(-)